DGFRQRRFSRRALQPRFVFEAVSPRLLPPVAVDWIWLIGLAVISQVFGQTAIAHALGRIPPAQAAIGLLIQPVSTALFAWVLFHESLSGLQLFGGALVLIAITAVRLFER
ncbi:MAG: DMT family transporter, partial [Terrimicrobium sp.]